MKKIIFALALALSLSSAAYAQETPRKVQNVEILDLDGEPAMLPEWGKQNLVIFYIDPDRAGMNQDFTEYLEESGRIDSDKIKCFGVINLKDAPFIPNKLARSMAEKRTASNGATVLADQSRAISKAWALGDCNNLFVTLMVNTDGELIYLRKGVLSDEDKEAFFSVVESWK